MTFFIRVTLFALAILQTTVLGRGAYAADQVKTASGVVEGTTGTTAAIRVFKGIPYAQPPVGDLRWKAPQPVKNWRGVLRTDTFGPRAMQQSLFGDMNFRSNGMGEDCLYLNVWTPAKSGKERLPVLVYFFGGGFVAGDGSEPRYDGESMARKGIVSITVNYRLNVFGFFAHPELTKEAPDHASGNYGLLDQSAALHWVQKNIAAFGGDPRKLTIAGESAGSLSVSAQMASPLSRKLIAGAIGESGSLMGTLSPIPLAEAEQNGARFAASLGVTSLAALRAMPAAQLLEAASKPKALALAPVIDGYFLPKPLAQIYAAGEQAHVPLLVGWNSEEMVPQAVLWGRKPTADNLAAAIRTLYPGHADEALRAYPAATDAEALQAATDLASDRFIAYSTWKWSDLHGRTGRKPVYRYFYSRARPAAPPAPGNAVPGPAGGAVHSAEIEYALGNLQTNKAYAWTPDDYRISATMQEYFADFVKTGDPNGPGLPLWPAANRGESVQFMHLDVDTRAERERNRARYLFLDQLSTDPGK